MTSTTESAILGGGCFWCLEAVFQRQAGVSAVTSAYAGGATSNPTYAQICGGDTGHAEVVKVDFSAAQVSYEEILNLFWRAHDPTTLNRQGGDRGTQYRSVILFASDAQRVGAEQSKAAAQVHFPSPIVTEISPLGDLWKAEEKHQNFFNRNGGHPYCAYNIIPKLQKLGMSSA